MEQIQITLMGFDVGFIGQTSCGIFGREASNVESGLNGSLNRRFGKIRCAGVATSVAHIDRHAQGFVAVALHVFQLTLAHADRQAAAFRGFGTRVGGTEFFGMVQGRVHQLFKVVTRVAEAVMGL